MKKEAKLVKLRIARLLKGRVNFVRTSCLVNNNKWFWRLSYSSRKILYVVCHPLRSYFLYNLIKKDVSSEMQSSLKPFKLTKSIFVRIPKSAGRSVSISLYGNLVGSHLPVKDYQIVFSEDDFNSYFKYTLVRNPWDRLVSAFLFLREGGVTGLDQYFSEKHLHDVFDFEDFVKNHLSKKEVLSFTHFRPQTDFLLINGELAIDFVGKFESIEEDFEVIKQKLNMPPHIELAKKNITGSRTKKDYRDYYNEEMIDIVRKVYQKDIELFDYQF